MADELTPTGARELLGAYSLGALDDDERRQVEQHLLADADARAELHALQLGASWLEQSSERPPEGAWDRIAAQLDDALGQTADAHHDDLPAVASLSDHRSRRAGLGRVLAIAAAIVAVVVIAGGVRSAVVDDTNISDAALAAVAKAADQAPGATKLPLRDTDGKITANAVVLPNGDGILTAALPTLADRRTYELWALTDDGPISLGTLGRDGRPHAFRFRHPMSGMAVTNEPADGGPKPTGPVVARGDLSTA
jgi:anti-sigma-K factor RskA